jgi:hypothetical protein
VQSPSTSAQHAASTSVIATIPVHLRHLESGAPMSAPRAAELEQVSWPQPTRAASPLFFLSRNFPVARVYDMGGRDAGRRARLRGRRTYRRYLRARAPGLGQASRAVRPAARCVVIMRRPAVRRASRHTPERAGRWLDCSPGVPVHTTRVRSLDHSLVRLVPELYCTRREGGASLASRASCVRCAPAKHRLLRCEARPSHSTWSRPLRSLVGG